MAKKVLVTGGCGFIGANFVRLILKMKEDWQVINLDKLTYAGNLENLKGVDGNPHYHYVRGDICNEKLLEKLFLEYNIDTVVHFAAESHVDRSITGPDEFVRTNVFGTLSLLNVAKKRWIEQEVNTSVNDCRFLHVSTDEVYGSLGESGYFTEATCYDPRSPYSASKASSDHLVRAYYHTYGLPVLVTNCSNNYGPYQFPEKLIPLVISNALAGKEIPVYGDGGNIRDWLYVEDHCEAIIQTLEKGRVGESYNIGGHNEKKNLEVVELICDLLDMRVGLLPGDEPRRSLVTFVTDRLGHDRRYAIDAAKIDKEFGWCPKMTFETGMEKTVDWYLDNREWMDSVIDGSYREYYETMYGNRKLESS